MSTSYKIAGYKSKLIEIPTDPDTKQLSIILKQNLDIIWKTLNDIRARLDAQSK